MTRSTGKKDRWSHNQQTFIKDAISQGFKVDYDYSGRAMYGRECPSIYVQDLLNDFTSSAKVKSDNMGKGYVIYAQN